MQFLFCFCLILVFDFCFATCNQPTTESLHHQICDDCCQGYSYLGDLARVYRTLKSLDPYTITAGAAECGELHAFQEPFLSLDAPRLRERALRLGDCKLL